MMLLPMVILSIFSIFSGYLLKDFFSGTSTVFADSIYIDPKNFKQTDADFIPVIYKLLPTIFSFIGMFLAVILANVFNIQCTRLIKQNNFIRFIYESLCSGYYFDGVYNKFIAEPFIRLCILCYNSFDKEVCNSIGPTIVSTVDNTFAYYKNQATVMPETSIKRPVNSIILSTFMLVV